MTSKRSIPGLLKDENGIFVRPAASASSAEPPLPKKRNRDPKPSDISLNDLMDKHLLLLYRETKMLLQESSKGAKLSKESALCVRENLKLLMELKKKEKELLDTASDAELKKLVEDASET